MNVTIKQMQAFVAVAEARNFTGAAQKLGLSQPSVTLAVRQLEENLGIELLERTTRRVRLSEKGQGFLLTAERLLGEFKNALDHVQAELQLERSRLSIAAVPSVSALILPKMLHRFSEPRPDLKVHLRDTNTVAVQRHVIAGEVDLGFGTQSESEANLKFEPLLSDRLGIVCHRDHPFANEPEPVKWKKLAGSSFFGVASDSGLRPLLDEIVHLLPSQTELCFEFSNPLTLGAMLEQGVGFTVMPYLGMVALRSSQLVYREVEGPVIERNIGLFLRRGGVLSRVAQDFRDLTHEESAAFVENHREMCRLLSNNPGNGDEIQAQPQKFPGNQAG